MNWDMRTAAGREKLMIRYRKDLALRAMGPDLFPDHPGEFLRRYMAADCVLWSGGTPRTGGAAVADFLLREKQACGGLAPIPLTDTVEDESGDILLRIRPWKAEEGELVRVELNADGLVCRIDRFPEKGTAFRAEGPGGVVLEPARIVETDGKRRYACCAEEAVSLSGLYTDELKLLFYLQDDVFEDMEDRYMETDEWTGLAARWREINAAEDEEALHLRLLQAEERYTRDNPRYKRELEELIGDLLRKREPYGRRMQAMLEDWVNGVRGRYPYIRKC